MIFTLYKRLVALPSGKWDIYALNYLNFCNSIIMGESVQWP